MGIYKKRNVGVSGGVEQVRRSLGLLALALLAALVVIIGFSAAPAWAQEGSEGEVPVCVKCHEYVSAEVASTWITQNHGRNGVECSTCHNSHGNSFEPNPTAGICFGCHDVPEIHPDFSVETPGKRCMECHTANIHLMPGQGSWFQGGLSKEKLEASGKAESAFGSGFGRWAGILVVALTVLLGLAVGLVMDRFVREL